MIEVEVIRDSRCPLNTRITTFRLRYPKFIHGEFMTHRVFSRNASSSRAIPTSKLLEEVRSDELRASPVFWGKNQKGMQAVEELDDTINTAAPDYPGIRITARDRAKMIWRDAALHAADQAELLLKIDGHKQIVNRILEPFCHINVIVTATEYKNFFGLRLDKGAQPEIRELAKKMWIERKKSTPQTLLPGEWHLPFIDKETEYELCGPEDQHGVGDDEWIKHAQMVSTARCARVSYTSFETGKKSTVEEDFKLYDRLLSSQPLHASPAEHQATPDRRSYVSNRGFEFDNPKLHGNFHGWIQFRQTIKNQAIAPLPEEFFNEEHA